MRSFIANPHHSSARSSRSTPLAIILVTLAAIACGSSTPAPAPKISSTTPLDAAASVALTTKPSVVFDRAMAPLTATNFTLKQGTAAVAGTVATSTDGTTATFTPASALAAGQGFTATITAGTKSAAGGSFAADQSWKFTTAASAGTTAPALASTSPTKGATGVALNAKLAAAFNVAMTPLTGTNFTLKQGTTAVVGTVANSADGTIAIFAPSANLTAGAAYTATIASATSAAGVALAAPYSWSFTAGTAVDNIAPVVNSKNPADTATGVAINTTVSATFSKSMDPQTITTATFTLKQGTTPVLGSVSYGPGTTTAIFTPASALSISITYTAGLSTGVKDMEGNALASAISWSSPPAPTPHWDLRRCCSARLEPTQSWPRRASPRSRLRQ